MGQQTAFVKVLGDVGDIKNINFKRAFNQSISDGLITFSVQSIGTAAYEALDISDDIAVVEMIYVQNLDTGNDIRMSIDNGVTDNYLIESNQVFFFKPHPSATVVFKALVGACNLLFLVTGTPS